ncbi:hypothetical protein L4X63_04525 [Geomonas sp. Red32]|uniref:hypothetical protein n=1 Tax=Geomonas sp. Red32 TaxID=2912856 RepID=UPI00202CC096|nr:hypothetical protein [Geomonas sp. Red32]MCM0080851.1 hypothetical protein [Geomonas sp. Red32]
MELENPAVPVNHEAMLAVIRRRRWYLWGLILLYLPVTMTILRLTESVKVTGAFFGIWVVLLCVAMALYACCKCPGCGKTFHMKNSTLSFSRKCRHCGLDISGGGDGRG